MSNSLHDRILRMSAWNTSESRFRPTPHPRVAHHLEPGYNGIYLTRVFDSWVRDVVIENADSGILTEGASNVTIERVTTSGTSMAHYSVQLGGVHNFLVRDLRVENPVEHPLSFNTFANKSVYLNAYV
jgi:hypothetical protein